MARSTPPSTPAEPTEPAAEPGRGAFGSRLGFILAAIGSAVGFGSIARFPMNAANNGGAMFVIMYLFIMLLVGIPMMIAEFSIGRSAQKNTVGAFGVLTGNPNTRWRFLGFLFFLTAAFILSYYAVLSGWTLIYFLGSLTQGYFENTADFGATRLEGPTALFYLAVVMALTAFVLTGKVSKGIEKLNLFMMPALFAMIIGIAIYASTLDNIAAGYEFYLQPDFSAFTVPVFTAAIGQAFFSLSLGQGAMMTYASYLPKTTSLAANASMVSLSTLVFAILCGFMVFPLLSTFGLLNPDTPAGLGLIFGPLPLAFAEMGAPVGIIVGSIFFLATFFASFTSAVSLAEPAVSYVIEQHNVDRRRASILVCGLIYIAGIAVALSTPLLDLEGGDLTDIFIIIGGLGIALYVGWFSPAAVSRQRMDECESGWKFSAYVYPLMRYVLPAILVVLLFFKIFGTPCALSGGAAHGGLLELLTGAETIGCDG